MFDLLLRKIRVIEVGDYDFFLIVPNEIFTAGVEKFFVIIDRERHFF